MIDNKIRLMRARLHIHDYLFGRPDLMVHARSKNRQIRTSGRPPCYIFNSRQSQSTSVARPCLRYTHCHIFHLPWGGRIVCSLWWMEKYAHEPNTDKPEYDYRIKMFFLSNQINKMITHFFQCMIIFLIALHNWISFFYFDMFFTSFHCIHDRICSYLFVKNTYHFYQFS